MAFSLSVASDHRGVSGFGGSIWTRQRVSKLDLFKGHQRPIKMNPQFGPLSAHCRSSTNVLVEKSCGSSAQFVIMPRRVHNRDGVDPAVAERRADRLWADTLSRFPTAFGRLVYLAALHDQRADAYSHQTLESEVGQALGEQTIRKSHVQIVSDWLDLNPEVQLKDLLRYLPPSAIERDKMLGDWIKVEFFRTLSPAALPPERTEALNSCLRSLIAKLLRAESVKAASVNDRCR